MPVPEAMIFPHTSAVSAEANSCEAGGGSRADVLPDLPAVFFGWKHQSFLGDPVDFKNQGHSAKGLPGSTRQGWRKDWTAPWVAG